MMMMMMMMMMLMLLMTVQGGGVSGVTKQSATESYLFHFSSSKTH